MGVVRYVPGAMAEALVTGGSAAAKSSTGRVREVALTRTAEHNAQRIGEASAPNFGTRFYRRVNLDTSASRIFEHHPRSFWRL
jgi:hypothetical protein